MITPSLRRRGIAPIVIPSLVLIPLIVGAAIGTIQAPSYAWPVYLCIAIFAGVTLAAPLEWGVATFLAFTCVAGILKILVDYAPIAHLGNDIVLAFLILSFMIRTGVRKGLSWRAVPFVWPACVLIATGALLTLAPWTTPIQALGGWKAYLLPLVLLPIGAVAFRQPGSLAPVARVLVVMALANALASLIESALGSQTVASFGPGFVNLSLGPGTHAYSGSDIYWRTFGLAQDAGSAAAIEGAGAIISLAYALRAGPARWVYSVGAVILSSAVILSAVRSALVVVVVGFVLVLLLRGRVKGRRLGAAAAAFSLIGVSWAVYLLISSGNPVVQSRVSSLTSVAAFQTSRGGLLGEIPATVLDSPFGVGMGKTVPSAVLLSSLAGVQQEAYANENAFLAMTLELGVGGLVATLLVAVLFIRDGYRWWRNGSDDDEVTMSLAICGGIVSIALAAPILVGQPTNVFFWTFGAVAAIRSRPIADRTR